MKKKLEKEIDELIKRFYTIEKKDENRFSPKIKEIRHWIIYFHSKIEGDLIFVLALSMTKEIKTFTDEAYKNYTIMLGRMSDIATSFNFVKKTEMAFALNDIDEKLKKMLYKLNNLRKYFSHPTNYKGEIKKFENDNYFLNTLKLLRDCNAAVSVAFDKYYKVLDFLIESTSKTPQDKAGSKS